MNRIAAVVFFSMLPSLVMAQQQQAAPEDYQAAINALQAQRDSANNQIVDLATRIAQLQRENTKLKEEAAKSKKAE